MKSLKRLMALAGAGAVISILLKKSPMGVVRRFLARQFEDWVPGEVKKIPSPFSWIVITPENQIHLYIPKVEIGQGIHTALAQIIAEELDVGWDQLEVKQATPEQFPDKEGTQSSNSVATLYTVLRQSAAAMRMALADEASRLLGAEITSNGQGLFETADGRTITYGEVIQQGQLKIGPTTNLSLKHREEFQYIGKSMPRIDLLEKVTGRASYGYTYQLPDMLYGAVLSPPAFNGRFEHIDSAAAQALPGVVQVVVDLENQFAGVVAESREMAQRGVACLEVTWADKHLWQQKEIEAIVTVGNGTGVVVQGEETVDRAYQLSAEYRTAMATHAHLEPQSAVADVRSDQAVLYASTQFAWEMRQKVAKRLGLKLEKVTVHSTYVGGGFGNKLNVENGIEAALLSQAVGRPVQLSWTLKDDLRRSYLRPPSHHLLRGSVSNGCIEIFEHEIASGDIGFTYVPVRPLIEFAFGADPNNWIGATVHRYEIPEVMVKAWHTKLPMKTGWWRGLGLLPNLFAVESFIDELAHAAQIDPLAFRLNHLAKTALGERYCRVLEAVAELSGWGNALPTGYGRGIACGAKVDTIVAQVAEVSVEDGRIKVHKVFAAVDAGLIINPDGARAQVEGAIVMGLGSALFEEVRVADSQLNISNFDDYRLPTMLDSPEIEVCFVGDGEEPLGMGEAPIGPVPAAIGNAVFAATGQRLRQLPLKL